MPLRDRLGGAVVAHPWLSMVGSATILFASFLAGRWTNWGTEVDMLKHPETATGPLDSASTKYKPRETPLEIFLKNTGGRLQLSYAENGQPLNASLIPTSDDPDKCISCILVMEANDQGQGALGQNKHYTPHEVLRILNSIQYLGDELPNISTKDLDEFSRLVVQDQLGGAQVLRRIRTPAPLETDISKIFAKQEDGRYKIGSTFVAADAYDSLITLASRIRTDNSLRPFDNRVYELLVDRANTDRAGDGATQLTLAEVTGLGNTYDRHKKSLADYIRAFQ